MRPERSLIGCVADLSNNLQNSKAVLSKSELINALSDDIFCSASYCQTSKTDARSLKDPAGLEDPVDSEGEVRLYMLIKHRTKKIQVSIIFVLGTPTFCKKLCNLIHNMDPEVASHCQFIDLSVNPIWF